MARLTRETDSARGVGLSQIGAVIRANWGKLLLVAIGVSVWLVFGTAESKREPTYTVACGKTARSLPFLLAHDKGYFEAAGLRVVLSNTASTQSAVEDLVAGKLEAAAALPLLALYESEAKKPGALKIAYFVVADSDGINDAILVRKASMISKPAHLRGKTLAVSPGRANVVFARLVLKGILDANTEVSIVELPAEAQLHALERREVHALLAFQPLIHMAQAKGTVRVLVENPIEKHVVDPVPLAAAVVSANFAHKHPKGARSLIKAAQKAIDSIRDDKAAATRVAARILGLDRDATAALPLPTFWRLTDIRKDQADHMQRFADILQAEGIIDSPVDVRSMFVKKLRAAGKATRPNQSATASLSDRKKDNAE